MSLPHVSKIDIFKDYQFIKKNMNPLKTVYKRDIKKILEKLKFYSSQSFDEINNNTLTWIKYLKHYLKYA